MSEIKFTIDGKECKGRPGQTIVEAAKENGIYIPVLCYYEGLKPAGICRICTVKVGGRYMAACTTPLAEGMIVENDGPGPSRTCGRPSSRCSSSRATTCARPARRAGTASSRPWATASA